MHTTESLTANIKFGVLEQLNYAWHCIFHCLGEFRWKKELKGRLAKQMTKSLTLLRKFTKGSHSRITNP
jgi:hypothetical protein